MFTLLALVTLSLPMLIRSSFSCNYGSVPCKPDGFDALEECIPNDYWCDSGCDCSDCEDETFCAVDYCEKLNGTFGNIAYTPPLSHNKCWSIAVPPNKYLKLDLKRIVLLDENCWKSRVLVNKIKGITKENILTICSNNSTTKEIETLENIEISYKNSPIHDRESLYFEYRIVDVLCKRSDAFKCTNYSCITPEKRCDGIRDCSNGLDEIGCEKGVFTVQGVYRSRQLALQWLKNQRTAAWGWRHNTHRAVTAMYLANGAHFNGTDKEEDLTAKQLELQMSTAILRNGTDVISPTQLSMFINALLVICHDPKNFYGYNLISGLKKQVKNSKQFHPNPYLALCNAGVTLAEEDIDKLLSVLDGLSQYDFNTEIEAITTLALSCAIQNNQFIHLKENLTRVTKSFKDMQMEDGSFGNLYTTALVVQALLATGEEEARDWNLKSAVEFLKGKQNKEDGSFGDFLATYLILPILNGKSLLDIGKINCTDNLKMPRNGNPVSDIDSKLGTKITVSYSLYIGDHKDQQHPIFLRVPENITVLEMMRLAAEADPKYGFKYETFMNRIYIYEISGIINDPEDGKFWLLHTGQNKDAIQMETKGADEINVYDQEHVVMWYKWAKLL